MIVYGGADGNLALSSNVLIDTNANGSGGVFAGAWSDLIVSGVFPPPRANHTAVYDQTNNRMIVFAGCGDPFCTFLPLNDTWVLTHANGLGGDAGLDRALSKWYFAQPAHVPQRGIRRCQQPHDRL